MLFQVLGRGTKALAQLKPGDQISALVPLGNCWIGSGNDQQAASRLPEKALIVSGGIGSASVLMLAEELKQKKINTHIFFGAVSESAAAGCGLKEFRDLNVPMEITTDDGSLGEQGFVTTPLEQHLISGTESGSVIYTCGPWGMMKRVAEISTAFRIPCYVSLEAPMSCGFGVCVGCVVAVKPADDSPYSRYKRVCVDGTIFPASTIDWDVQSMSH